MPLGSSPLLYPDQPPPPLALTLDDSYFLVRLHAAQVFFDPGWLRKPGYVIVSSTVTSTFHPNQIISNLHYIRPITKNEPNRLGISAHLTDWLPARSTDSIQVALRFTVVQDKPFDKIVAQMGNLDLAGKVSLANAEWGVAIKITEIVGKILGFLLEEGSEHPVLPLDADLNLATLKAGYHAVIGSSNNADWPSSLKMNDSGGLSYAIGSPLEKLSYATFQVLTLSRRGLEVARGEPWWELLQAGQDQILNAFPENDHARQKLYADWRATLTQVRLLARQEHSCLLNELNQIIQQAQKQVDVALAPQSKGEAMRDETFDAEWQELLGAKSERELNKSVAEYQAQRKSSEQLEQRYSAKEKSMCHYSDFFLRRVRQVFSRCDEFNDYHSLANAFAISRVAYLRARLQYASNKNGLMDNALALLIANQSSAGECALPAFLDFLRARYFVEDMRHSQLTDLIAEYYEGEK